MSLVLLLVICNTLSVGLMEKKWWVQQLKGHMKVDRKREKSQVKEQLERSQVYGRRQSRFEEELQP